MAIQDKFVSSFAELYIADRTQAGFAAAYNTALTPLLKQGVVRDFFTPKNGVNSAAVDVTTGIHRALVVGDVISYTYTLSATNFNVYFKVTRNISVGATGSLTADFATLDTIFASNNVAFLSTRVPLVMEIGTLGNEANVIEVNEFGQPLKGKLRGQSDGGQLDSSIFWAPGNAVHNWLHQAATNGTPTTGGIKYKETQNAEPGQTQLAVFNSFVSSFNIETAFDDVMKASMTQPIDGNEYFAPGA